MKSSEKAWVKMAAAGGLVLLGLALTRCGTGNEQASSQLSASATPIEVTADLQVPEQAYYLSDGSNMLLIPDLERRLGDELGRSLARFDLIPTNLPQFFSARLVVSNFDGCEFQWWDLHCAGIFKAKFQLAVKAGPDTIDSSGLTATFENVEERAFTRRARWAIDRLVDDLVERGLLDSINVETPYF